MSVMKFKKSSFQLLFASCIASSMVSAPLLAQTTSEKPQSQITFSDPAKKADVGADFLKQAVRYDRSVGEVDVVINLGQQTYPALHGIVEDIAREHGIKVNVQRGSCGTTARKLLKKTIDIGTYCCPPGRSDRLPGLKFHTVAIAPLALVTNTTNPVNNVSAIDAQKIFRGDYVYWSDVPDSDQQQAEKLSAQLTAKKIKPVVRLHCKKRPGHWRLLLKDADSFSPVIQEVSVIPDMIKNVAEDISAIGYETPYMLEVHKNKGKLKILSIDGIDPNDLSQLTNGNYPIYRTYNMTTWSNPENHNAKAEALLKYIIEYVESHGEEYGFITASRLRQAGWKFLDGELIAAPDGMPVISEHQ
ncbi:MAG: hypothetical protein IMF14_08195 [Proteobacteria bacterium]|nr:hypothetical protein [Pseudomonadota bacterium]